MGYARSTRVQSSAKPRIEQSAKTAEADRKCPEFMDLMNGEKILRVVHPSFLNYIWPLFWIGFFLISWARGENSTTEGTIVAGILLFFFLATPFLIYAAICIVSTVTVITNHRVIMKKGFIATNLTEVRISDIRGINRSHGVFQAFLGLDNISIGTAATAGAEIKVVGIRHAKSVTELINSLRPMAWTMSRYVIEKFV